MTHVQQVVTDASESELRDAVLGLPASRRAALAQDLWESIESAADALPLTEAQQRELDRRIAEFEADPTPGVPWREAMAKLREDQACGR